MRTCGGQQTRNQWPHRSVKESRIGLSISPGSQPQHHEAGSDLECTGEEKVGKTQGPGSRRVSNGLTNIRRDTKVFGRKLRGHVGFVGCCCS